jgi:hypothetical protein
MWITVTVSQLPTTVVAPWPTMLSLPLIEGKQNCFATAQRTMEEWNAVFVTSRYLSVASVKR